MRVLRTRTIQPDNSPGVVVAGIALLVVIGLDKLEWWSLLLVLMIPPLVNKLLVGKTTRKEHVLEKDI